MKYVITAVLSFGAGAVLGLSEAQAKARTASLAPIPDRKGWYTTTGPVQFKRGEEILCEGDLPKAMADKVEPPAKAKAPAKRGNTPEGAGGQNPQE